MGFYQYGVWQVMHVDGYFTRGAIGTASGCFVAWVLKVAVLFCEYTEAQLVNIGVRDVCTCFFKNVHLVHLTPQNSAFMLFGDIFASALLFLYWLNAWL